MTDMRWFKIVLSDGTRCQCSFKSEDEARDFFDIMYNVDVDTIVEIDEQEA